MTAHKARENCSQVFRYAVATQRAQRDPTVDLRGAIPPAKVRHFPAVIEPKEVGLLLRALHGYEGSFVVKCAMRLAPLVFVRPGELRMAKGDDIHLAHGLWRFTVSKTKTRLIVPLSRQAIAILTELQQLTVASRCHLSMQTQENICWPVRPLSTANVKPQAHSRR